MDSPQGHRFIAAQLSRAPAPTDPTSACLSLLTEGAGPRVSGRQCIMAGAATASDGSMRARRPTGVRRPCPASGVLPGVQPYLAHDRCPAIVSGDTEASLGVLGKLSAIRPLRGDQGSLWEDFIRAVSYSARHAVHSVRRRGKLPVPTTVRTWSR